MRSPIPWFGGKGNMVKKILPLFPPHHTYVEPFGGGASLLFAKPPSPVEVYNDLDSGLVNFFRVLRDPVQGAELQRLASLTPYSREEWKHCRDTWSQCTDEVQRAYRWLVTARMSFGGRFGHGWGFVVTESSRNMANTCKHWLTSIEQLPQITQRLLRVQIDRDDWRAILPRYDTPQTLFYLDPPYVPATRRGGEYQHEMTLEDHEELVQALLQLQGKSVLSGYQHPVYMPLEQVGWVRHDFTTACFAAGRTRGTDIQGVGAALTKQPRVESVWVSPHSTREQALQIRS